MYWKWTISHENLNIQQIEEKYAIFKFEFHCSRREEEVKVIGDIVINRKNNKFFVKVRKYDILKKDGPNINQFELEEIIEEKISAIEEEVLNELEEIEKVLSE